MEVVYTRLQLLCAVPVQDKANVWRNTTAEPEAHLLRHTRSILAQRSTTHAYTPTCLEKKWHVDTYTDYPEEPKAEISETDISEHRHIKPKLSTWLSSTGGMWGYGCWWIHPLKTHRFCWVRLRCKPNEADRATGMKLSASQTFHKQTVACLSLLFNNSLPVQLWFTPSLQYKNIHGPAWIDGDRTHAHIVSTGNEWCLGLACNLGHMICVSTSDESRNWAVKETLHIWRRARSFISTHAHTW